MSNIEFAKYHGCGNDFIIIEYLENFEFSSFAKKVCHRNLGIGADGLIVVKKDPLEMLFFNADGSRGTMCGNGIRCFAKYCYDQKIVDEDEIDVITLAGIMKIKSDKMKEQFKVNMGKPNFSTTFLKMKTTLPTFINEDFMGVKVNALFMGTVHVVVFVDDLKSTIKTDLGEKISNASIFDDRSNVNFVQIIDNHNFLVKTYERGVGWTLACGTGACSSYVIGKLHGFTSDYVNIHFEYGTLKIEDGINDDIYMSGPAVKIVNGFVKV